MDGSLQLTGHHGQLMHGVIAHRNPVTALCYSGDCVISGGYDGAVKVSLLIEYCLFLLVYFNIISYPICIIRYTELVISCLFDH